MTVHVYVYENTETTLWFESLVVCEGGPWRLLREYDKEIPDPVGPGGTTDYNQLSNRPQINSVLLSGNKTNEQLKITEFSAVTDSASIENTTDGTLKRLAIGLEDNTDKISVNIRYGTSEKQMNAETEKSMKNPADAGLAPVVEIPNNARLMGTQDPQAQTFAYVMMGDNVAWVGELTTNTSPYVYKRLGTDTTMVTLEVAKDGDEWELYAYDGTMDQKNWRFFTSSPVIPRVQSWLKGIATVRDVNAGDAALQAQIDAIQVGNNFEVDVEKWQGTYTEDGVTYQVYSKIVKIDALPAAAGITNYPHGIQNIKQILSTYGFTTDGFVLNAPRQNAQDNIAIYQVSKNNTTGSIAIEVGKDRSSKKAYVCLVYAKNN